MIALVTPAPRGSTSGNRVTALRWARALRRLGQRVRVETELSAPADVLLALHAMKSHDAIVRFRREAPGAPVVLALTGTDLLDLPDERARRSLALADRIVVLQERALALLSPADRDKARVIVQSASRVPAATRSGDGFVACVLAHLRAVKDPLRAAEAARRLPSSSRVSVAHAGAALDPELELAARREMRENPRYRWLGDLPRARALSLLAGSDVLVLSSLAEGGANAVTEAIASEVPVISSRIDGSIGLLGPDHPGYFTPGDSEELAALLSRAERDRAFAAALRERSRRLAVVVDPALEVERWRALVEELG